MPQIAAFEDVKVRRKERQTPTGTAWRTNFIDADENDPATAQAFLVEGTPGRVIRSHYHDHDQYQVIVSGDGVLGKHQLQVNAVHFSRRHTPYGPVVFGQGMSFLTLRAHKDAGAQYIDEPEKLAKLTKINTLHMEQVAYYLKRMSETKDGNGTLLDNTLLLAGASLADPNKHSHKDLPTIVAGGMTTGGRHLVAEKGTPMTNLMLSMMDQLGVKVDKLGDSTGRLTGYMA